MRYIWFFVYIVGPDYYVWSPVKILIFLILFYLWYLKLNNIGRRREVRASAPYN